MLWENRKLETTNIHKRYATMRQNEEEDEVFGMEVSEYVNDYADLFKTKCSL